MYAENTSVPVEKSRAEIEHTLNRYGATGFMCGWHGSKAMIAFELQTRHIKFFLPLPARDDKAFTTKTRYKRVVACEPEEAYKRWEQACRQRWRALALAIKAKLEAVETKITQLDEEFMAHIVMPDGLTLGERIIPQLTSILENNKLPPLLPGN